MGKKIRIILALAVIVGVAFWAFNGVRERTYNGTKLSFEVGSGYVEVNNLSQNVIPVEMRTDPGKAASFRIASTDLDLNVASKRQGSGRKAYHAVAFDLPPGRARIDVTRGSSVQFFAMDSGRIQATVTPMSAESARVTLGLAAAVILIALYYLSAVLEHRWLRNLVGRVPRRRHAAKRAAA